MAFAQYGRAAQADWATEIALDVEWAHAIAPTANIALIEASSNLYSDLLSAAVDTLSPAAPEEIGALRVVRTNRARYV